MFLIAGSPRSGTTLLATTLAQHDHLTVPGETDFIIPWSFLYDRVKDPKVGRKLLWQLIVSSTCYPRIGAYLSKRDIWKYLKRAPYDTRLLCGLYDLIAKKTGAKDAGDKSPNDLLYLRILVQSGLLHPDIKIVHLVRDVRDVLLSLLKTRWVADIETYFPRFWSNSNLYLHNLKKNQPSGYLLVKYEDMVAAPRETFVRITDFLHVPFDERMLDHKTRALEHRGNEFHENLQKPFLPSRARGWQTSMSEDLQRLCERQAREGLEVFGYERAVGTVQAA